jgi:hypothetical protein
MTTGHALVADSNDAVDTRLLPGPNQTVMDSVRLIDRYSTEPVLLTRTTGPSND